METTEAAIALVRAGRKAEAEKAIDEAIAAAGRRYRAILERTEYTADARRDMLKAAYADARESLRAKLESAARSAATAERSDAGRVFGTAGLPGDAASLVISRRDAGDRVASISAPTELRDLLRSATRSGDEVLARAVVQRAVEIGDANTVNAFTADRPHLEDATERLWDAERRGTSMVPMNVTMALMGLQPPSIP